MTAGNAFAIALILPVLSFVQFDRPDATFNLYSKPTETIVDPFTESQLPPVEMDETR